MRVVVGQRQQQEVEEVVLDQVLGDAARAERHSGCVAEYLVENDLFDFLLLSLPDNDTHSHKYGPFAQVDSIAAADRQIARMMDARRRAGRSSSRTTP